MPNNPMSAGPLEGSERARQAAHNKFDQMGEVLDKLRPGTGPGVTLLLKTAFDEGLAAGRSLEQERDELREKLDDLINCWDVFYTFLPDGEYRGIGQMRAACNQHRRSQDAAVHKGDS